MVALLDEPFLSYGNIKLPYVIIMLYGKITI